MHFNLESNHARKSTAITGHEDREKLTAGDDRARFGGSGFRDRINTGRIENLRTMGNELMRPASQEGKYSSTT